jgi:hypothetical protein
MESAIGVLIFILGIFFGVLYFLRKDGRPIAEQLQDIRRREFGDEPTEHGRIPL